MSDTTSDPLIAAIASTLEEVLKRGLFVTPTDSGWIIRLETEEAEELAAGVIRKAW